MHSNQEDSNISICIIRLSALGDCINALAMVQAIQKNFPKAQITWICGVPETKILGELTNSIQILTFDKKHSIKSYFKLRNELKNKNFTYLIQAQSAIRASLVSTAVHAINRIGFNKERATNLQCFFTNKKINSPQKKHVIDGFMEFAYFIGCSREPIDWIIKIKNESMNKAKNLLKTQKPVCLINPCTSKQSKNWTIDGYIAIADYMNQKGFSVFLIGGNSKIEKFYENEILAQRKNSICSLIGKTSLIDCFALISLSNIVISADTAAVHIANSLQKPVIGLYATHDPQRVGPYNFIKYSVSVYEEAIKKEYHKNSCELPWRTRVHLKDAMSMITPEMVYEKIDKICDDFKIL